MLRYKNALAVYQEDRTLIAPRVPNYSCSRRVLHAVDVDGVKVTDNDLIDFSSTPLGDAFLNEFVSYKTRTESLRRLMRKINHRHHYFYCCCCYCFV
jgi:hypothetical protein